MIRRTEMRRAFTLVELLVVVAIIGLLVAILLPVLGKVRITTLQTICAGNLRQIDVAMNMYLTAHGDTYPCAQDPVSTNPNYWLWMGRGWRSWISPYFNTQVNQDNPSVLYCVGDPAVKNKYEATSYSYSMCFYHSPAQIDAITSAADTYTNPQSFVAQRSRDVTHPSEKIVIGEWTANHPRIDKDSGWWTVNGCRNYLFADGQIRFLDARKLRLGRDNLPDPNTTINGIKGIDYP